MTKVKFYVEQGGDILAFFPDIVETQEGARRCYSHVGQHSSCSNNYLKHCTKATPDEYKDLLEELKGQGYDDLEVITDGRRKKEIT